MPLLLGHSIAWIIRVDWHDPVTYYVPTTLRVLISVSSLPNILAIPKSEILGVISLSKRMLLALRSLWMILYLESWWRYSKPRAIPSIIRYRVCQSSSLLLVVSGNKDRFLFACWKILILFFAQKGYGIPNKKQSKLLFSMYSYISIFSGPEMLHPISRTRFRCWSLAINKTSFLNSSRPCVDVLESVLTAISCPSSSLPCSYVVMHFQLGM